MAQKHRRGQKNDTTAVQMADGRAYDRTPKHSPKTITHIHCIMLKNLYKIKCKNLSKWLQFNGSPWYNRSMENTFTKEQLNAFEKDILVTMILQQQNALLEMNKKFDLLLEQIRISNQARFGQSSEKVELQNQLTFCFNEAEVTVADVGDITEPTIEQVIPEHKRREEEGQEK